MEVIVGEFSERGTTKRRKRKVNPETTVKSLKYLPKFDGIGGSVDPISIIGAKQVLLYNTKQKKIALYTSETGLSVKGSTLQNYTHGVVKTCGRKPDSWIQFLISCPPARIAKEINNLSSRSQVATGRINKDTLILRVIK